MTRPITDCYACNGVGESHSTACRMARQDAPTVPVPRDAVCCPRCDAAYDEDAAAALVLVHSWRGRDWRECACGATLTIIRARSVESRPPCELYAGPLTERGVL